ncbi:hypothetical protein GCM10012275_53060 [Longimycelium tulufanense]|uniref:Uncharacterized protein n=1 Tax=Longimycelium tulufanense TaxID=907463 RepID=A0A8J3FYG5_9PSEU|nr:hypothetical protein [Longimycelium tulufanense]GGM75736.1 hypothetical protein GCM10012275_53060 [Longimycelium tulufanense]
MSVYHTLARYRGGRLALAALLLFTSALLVVVTTPLMTAAICCDRLVMGLAERARRVPAGPEPTCLRRDPLFTETTATAAGGGTS